MEGSLLAIGALTGLVVGVFAAALFWGIQRVQSAVFSAHVEPWELVTVPTIGAFITGWIILRVAPEISGSGVVRTLEMIVTRGGRARRRTPFASVFATSIALGTGSSGGREGPIVLTGGAIGSLIGQLFRLDAPRMRAMIGAGGAGAIGAAFNAPIGGMLFAIEVILGQLRAQSLQVVVVSSVVASVTARELVGAGHILEVKQAYSLAGPNELWAYVLLGIFAAGLGITIMRSARASAAMFSALRRRLWPPFAMALGGLGVGLIALLMPEVLGTGMHLPPIDGIRTPVLALLTQDFGLGWAPLRWLLSLLLLKFLATMLSAGSGSAVGMLMPTLFLGAALGALVGTGLNTLSPGFGFQPQAFALVGMAAGFSAAARAPLTSVILVFELTGDYGLVLPLMLACGISTWLAERFEPRSVYSSELSERGLSYGEPEDLDVLQAVTVAEVMTVDHPSLFCHQSYPEIVALFEQTASHGFAVVSRDQTLVGVLTRTDLEAAPHHPSLRQGQRTLADLTAFDLASKPAVAVNPTDPVYTAVHRMAVMHVGRIPVVDRATKRLLGMMRRSDIVNAYQIGLTRHLDDQQQAKAQSLRDLTGVSFVEIQVHEGSAAAGLPIREIRKLDWPPQAVVVSIRRAGELVLPQGDTTLEARDEVILLADPSARAALKKLLSEPA